MDASETAVNCSADEPGASHEASRPLGIHDSTSERAALTESSSAVWYASTSVISSSSAAEASGAIVFELVARLDDCLLLICKLRKSSGA